MPQVSIIVPVYKVEPYIRRCLDSILAQTFTDWECILVDDGSPDQSGAICDEYAVRDARFVVIHQENQGVTRARANGVALARGEWINFVDSDDEIPPDSLKKLLSFTSSEVDIVVGKVAGWHVPEREVCSVEDYIRAVLRIQTFTGPVGKFFRRSLFDDYTFDIPREITCGEDALMNIRLARKARLMAFSSDVAYIYTQRITGTLASYHPSVKMISLYHQLKKESIGEAMVQKYLKDICHYSVYEWLSVTCEKVRLSKDDIKCKRELQNDVIKAKLEFSLWVRLIFYTESSYFRAFLVMRQRIMSGLKSLLSIFK